MRICELTFLQCSTIADYRPNWMANNQPEWMADNRPEWMADNRPEWMADNRPEWMADNRPEWMADNRPAYMADNRPEWMANNRPRLDDQQSTGMEILGMLESLLSITEQTTEFLETEDYAEWQRISVRTADLRIIYDSSNLKPAYRADIPADILALIATTGP
jgi:hypothetical protein